MWMVEMWNGIWMEWKKEWMQKNMRASSTARQLDDQARSLNQNCSLCNELTPSPAQHNAAAPCSASSFVLLLCTAAALPCKNKQHVCYVMHRITNAVD